MSAAVASTGLDKDCYGLSCYDFIPSTKVSDKNDKSITWNRKPQWMASVVQSLNEISSLPDNWDGYGAESIKFDVVIAVADIISVIMSEKTPAPAIVPTSNGSIQLEWHMCNLEIEIEIFSSTNLELYYHNLESEDEREETLSVDFRLLTEIVNKLNYS